MLYLSNAFSINMLNFGLDAGRAPEVQFRPISYADAMDLLSGEFTSAVGHTDTAAIISDLLNRSVTANRISVKLGLGDSILVAQFTGPRLPEGTTTLPEGASIQFLLCTINYW